MEKERQTINHFLAMGGAEAYPEGPPKCKAEMAPPRSVPGWPLTLSLDCIPLSVGGPRPGAVRLGDSGVTGNTCPLACRIL